MKNNPLSKVGIVIIILLFSLHCDGAFSSSISAIEISISLDKEEIAVGETITANYEITGGNGDYKRIELSWYQLIPGNDTFICMKETSNQADNSVNAKGSFSFVPTVSGKIRFNVKAYDTNNMSKLGQSKIVQVNGSNEPLPISITIALDKGDIGLGDTITASYEITGGNGDFKRIELGWYQLIPGNDVYINMAGANSDFGDVVLSKGSFPYTPTTEGLIRFNVIAYDTNNMSKLEKTNIITVSKDIAYPGSETLLLPIGIKHIHNAAFENTNFSYVVIPDETISIESFAFSNCIKLKVIKFLNGNENIADNAFDEDANLIFVCPVNSKAVAYAADHNYLCITYEK